MGKHLVGEEREFLGKRLAARYLAGKTISRGMVWPGSMPQLLGELGAGAPVQVQRLAVTDVLSAPGRPAAGSRRRRGDGGPVREVAHCQHGSSFGSSLTEGGTPCNRAPTRSSSRWITRIDRSTGSLRSSASSSPYPS